MKRILLNFIGIIEIVIGLLGTLVFIWAIFGMIYSFLFLQKEEGLPGAVALMALLGSIPFPFILWAGFATLKQKTWALKFQRIVAWISGVVLLFWSSLHVMNLLLGDMHYVPPLALDIILFFIIVMPLWNISKSQKVAKG